MSASIKTLMLITLTLLVTPTEAQIYVFTGFHENYVRNNALSNESPLTSWHLGGGARFTFSETHPRTVFNFEVATVRKGYSQVLGGEKSDFHFDYLTWQATVGHQLLPFMSVKGGLNLAVLFHANLKYWDETYKIADLGLVGGLDFLENKPVGIYTRVVYGLAPMLKYDNIDALGNFNGTIRDLRNTTIMVGITIKLYEREIYFRH